MQAHKILRKMCILALSAVLSVGASVNAGAIYTYDGNYEYNFYDTEELYGVYIDRIYDVKTKVIVKERINDLNVVMLQNPENAVELSGGELKNIFGHPSGYYAVEEGGKVPTKFYNETFNDVTETVILPDELKIIGAYSFFDCRKLSKINIPDGVEKIGDYAFYKCRFLKSVELLATVSEIGVNAFEKSGIKQIRIENPELDITQAGIPNDAEVTAQYDSKAYEFISAQNKRGGNFKFNEIAVPEINKEEVTIGLGESASLTVKAVPKTGGEAEKFTLRSSDESVMKVDKNGKITTVGVGSAYVIAKAESGGEAKCKVTVKKAPSKITLSKDSLTLDKNKSIKLTVSMASNETSSKITFTSSNPKICTVNATGLVKGISRGTATVTAKTYNGKTATCKVKVLDSSIIDAKSVALDKTSLIIGVNEVYSFKAEVAPANTTDKTVKWTSSNDKVAVVSQTGRVTGKSQGTATITAKTASGKTATCKITVKPAPSEITLEKTDIWLGVGESFRLWTHITNGTASNKRTFTSSDSKVCEVSANGTLTAKKIGTAVITVKTYNGKKATCKVTVKQPATQITLDTYRVELTAGKTFRLATHVPGNSASNTRTFTSTDTKVCTVDKSGVITAKSKGTAIIRVETYNGKKTSCQVVVK